jgi:hypothetical protein
VEVVRAAEVTAKPRTNLARGAPAVDRDDRTRMTVPAGILWPLLVTALGLFLTFCYREIT